MAPAGNTVDERGDSSGIGDLTLLGQYRFFNNQATRTEAALLLGVKAPTGRTNEYDKLGERFETEFQPGSGSWDGLFGLAFTQRFGAWSFDTNVLYQLVTNGAQETDLGDRFHYNAAVSYRLIGGAGDAGRAHEPGGDARADVPRRAQRPAATSTPTRSRRLRRPGPRSISCWSSTASGTAREGRRRQGRELGGNVVYLSPGVRLSMDKWSGFAVGRHSRRQSRQRRAGRARLAAADRRCRQLLRRRIGQSPCTSAVGGGARAASGIGPQPQEEGAGDRPSLDAGDGRGKRRQRPVLHEDQERRRAPSVCCAPRPRWPTSIDLIEPRPWARCAAGREPAALSVAGARRAGAERRGPHLLLSGVKKRLDAYDSFKITLVFEKAGSMEIEVMVEEAETVEPHKH